ncbi:unnamed protein product, partial [Ectocarpus fasciculatus]
AANTAARGEPTPKLTASALQHLQPTIPSPALAAFEARDLTEGLPSAAKQSMYWGPVKRNRTRDTLHSLIEGHAPLGTLEEPPTPRTGDGGGGG